MASCIPVSRIFFPFFFCSFQIDIFFVHEFLQNYSRMGADNIQPNKSVYRLIILIIHNFDVFHLFNYWYGERRRRKIVYLNEWRCRLLNGRECIVLSYCFSFILPIWIHRLKSLKGRVKVKLFILCYNIVRLTLVIYTLHICR